MVDGLNREAASIISVDGVQPNGTTVKVLNTLRKRLETLARHARFTVVLSAVVGSSPPEEVSQVVEFARAEASPPGPATTRRTSASAPASVSFQAYAR